jgi:hypothetical protein
VGGPSAKKEPKGEDGGEDKASNKVLDVLSTFFGNRGLTGAIFNLIRTFSTGEGTAPQKQKPIDFLDVISPIDTLDVIEPPAVNIDPAANMAMTVGVMNVEAMHVNITGKVPEAPKPPEAPPAPPRRQPFGPEPTPPIRQPFGPAPLPLPKPLPPEPARRVIPKFAGPVALPEPVTFEESKIPYLKPAREQLDVLEVIEPPKPKPAPGPEPPTLQPITEIPFKPETPPPVVPRPRRIQVEPTPAPEPTAAPVPELTPSPAPAPITPPTPEAMKAGQAKPMAAPSGGGGGGGGGGAGGAGAAGAIAVGLALREVIMAVVSAMESFLRGVQTVANILTSASTDLAGPVKAIGQSMEGFGNALVGVGAASIAAGAGLAILSAGALAPLGIALAGLGIVALGVGVALKLFGIKLEILSDLINNLNQNVARYAGFSPQLTQAAVTADVTMLRNDMRRAREVGPALTQFVQAQMDLSQKVEDIKAQVIQRIAPIIANILDVIGENLPAAETIVNLLTGSFGLLEGLIPGITIMAAMATKHDRREDARDRMAKATETIMSNPNPFDVFTGSAPRGRTAPSTTGVVGGGPTGTSPVGGL